MEQLEKRLYGYIKYLEKKENKIKETMENVNGAGHYFRAGQVEELRFVIQGFTDILVDLGYFGEFVKHALSVIDYYNKKGEN